MLSVFRLRKFALAAAAVTASGLVSASAQDPAHGRKYKPLPPIAHVVVTVEKGFNSKPLPNVAVVFHATRDGRDDGNLEVKTDPDGRAAIDVLEVGSHVTLQVIATGFATYSTEFDLTGDSKEMLVKLQRPRAQVSVYEDNDGKAAQVKPGTQERVIPKTAPATTTPPAAPATPATTTPPAGETR
ncbi:hypothetical protein SAMN05421819_2485 [Bryocella elongata]|uniref:Carboxypeptidase regulatory-like domain-containing protein n=1 Tax=Bryocella elongata TaxID=863522 RepID=A0A1H5Z6A6_9BACT|nr:carboxypeptidase-like regulatory domain-containing protein [Bryocella elongata]SEG31891.1 hypothetical protein SAMN05421819_2485 [Bryocella elongata]